MGHVAIPFTWIQFLFHRGCWFNLKSILEAGLIAGMKESREGGQAVFSTPLDPWGNAIEEKSKVTCRNQERYTYKTEWKGAQDAVCWIHLAKAQEKGMHNILVHKKSHAIIAHKTVPLDCIEGVISQKSETT